MSGRRVAFRQGDVTRAIKGAIAAGIEPGPVEIYPDGLIIIMPKDMIREDQADPLAKWEAGYRASKN